MSLYCATGSVETDLSPQQSHDLLVETLAKLGKRNRVLIVPPDQSSNAVGCHRPSSIMARMRARRICCPRSARSVASARSEW